MVSRRRNRADPSSISPTILRRRAMISCQTIYRRGNLKAYFPIRAIGHLSAHRQNYENRSCQPNCSSRSPISVFGKSIARRDVMRSTSSFFCNLTFIAGACSSIIMHVFNCSSHLYLNSHSFFLFLLPRQIRIEIFLSTIIYSFSFFCSFSLPSR